MIIIICTITQGQNEYEKKHFVGNLIRKNQITTNTLKFNTHTRTRKFTQHIVHTRAHCTRVCKCIVCVYIYVYMC